MDNKAGVLEADSGDRDLRDSVGGVSKGGSVGEGADHWVSSSWDNSTASGVEKGRVSSGAGAGGSGHGNGCDLLNHQNVH